MTIRRRYTLPLHDALPIYIVRPTVHPQTPPTTTSDKTGHAGYVQSVGGLNVKITFPFLQSIALRQDYIGLLRATLRSEEHTSELQSHSDLVCRLLLEQTYF